MIVLELCVKLTNHVMVVKSSIDKNGKDDEDKVYFDEPLSFDPFTNNGLLVIKTDYVVMDAILVVAMVVMYVIQMSLDQRG